MSEPLQLTAGGHALNPGPAMTLDAIPPLRGPRDRMEAPAAAYLHVPFCFHKCHYCDFYSIVDAQDRREPFTDRMVRELQAAAPWFSRPLQAIFVGGGTPTLLTPSQWSRLLAAMTEHLPGFPGCECTVEANPETVSTQLMEVLVAGGVNRVSIGAQSFDRRHLATLERHHDPEAVGRAVSMVREAGVRRVSLDLIFGVPGQTLGDWQQDLERALDLGPAHLSCYGLTYEPGTPLTRRRDVGRIEAIDPDIEASMYEWTIHRLAEAGFEHYEISNWARPGEACRHNLAYWQAASWWAFGPSGVGQLRDAAGLGGWRWRNVPRLGEWLASDPWPPVKDVERIEPAVARGEAFMLGLRLVAGMDRGWVETLLAGDPEPGGRRETIQGQIADGQLEWAGDRLRLTEGGRMVADSVIGALL